MSRSGDETQMVVTFWTAVVVIIILLAGLIFGVRACVAQDMREICRAAARETDIALHGTTMDSVVALLDTIDVVVRKMMDKRFNEFYAPIVYAETYTDFLTCRVRKSDKPWQQRLKDMYVKNLRYTIGGGRR